LNNIIKLAERKDIEEFPVVIVNFNNRKLGFIVDELIGKHETVIKTLEKNFRNISGLTGASIMGDGTIILVLDIQGLIELTNTNSGSSELEGKEMLRLNNNRTIDSTTSNKIFKTINSTNLYNSKLQEMNLMDKSRKKKDKSQEKKKIVQHRIEPDYIEQVEELPKEMDHKQMQEESPVPEEISQIPEKNSIPEKVIEEQVAVAHDPKILDENLKAKEILKSLSDQTKSRVEQLIERPIDQMLSPAEIRKLEAVVNTGMMNAGLVLSQLVGSNVELFMPEIMLTDKEGLVGEIREPDEEYFGLKIRMNGDLNGNLLMIFSEEKGKSIAAKLLNSNDTSADLAKKISEDSLSVLMEISNIVCASVINSLSNKAKCQIMPSVPELVTGNFREVLDIVKPEKTKFLCMNTEFIYEGDNMIGNLIFLPDFDELTVLISKLT
jgi:two-component system chemotaxis sensor kinase CheA